MLDYLVFSIALIGTALAGWQDFKTSGIEDKYAIFIGGSGILIYLANSIYTGVWTGLYHSIAVGIGFLAFGYIMYYANQWGEADVLILGALGFLIPASLSFFALQISFPYYALFFIATVFIVGGAYSILYSAGIALQTKGFFGKFIHVLEQYSNILLKLLVCLFIFSVLSIRYAQDHFFLFIDIMLRQLLLLHLLVIIGYVFICFAKTIDRYSFRRQVNVSDLCEGDVLAENLSGADVSKKLKGKLFAGLNSDDIKSICKIRKKVWIKEGVRFAPTFFFSLIFVWLIGNVFAILL